MHPKCAAYWCWCVRDTAVQFEGVAGASGGASRDYRPDCSGGTASSSTVTPIGSSQQASHPSRIFNIKSQGMIGILRGKTVTSMTVLLGKIRDF